MHRSSGLVDCPTGKEIILNGEKVTGELTGRICLWNHLEKNVKVVLIQVGRSLVSLKDKDRALYEVLFMEYTSLFKRLFSFL